MQYPVPASEATVATTVSFRGVRLVGKSQLEASADGGGLRKRIPTVFSPFHGGTKFNISDHPSSPGVAIHFTNVTLLLPNSTFAGIFDSGLMDFFEMGRFARFCFTDRYAHAVQCYAVASSQRALVHTFATSLKVGCPLRGCSLFWFLGVAGLIPPSPWNTSLKVGLPFKLRGASVFRKFPLVSATIGFRTQCKTQSGMLH